MVSLRRGVFIIIVYGQYLYHSALATIGDRLIAQVVWVSRLRVVVNEYKNLSHVADMKLK